MPHTTTAKAEIMKRNEEQVPRIETLKQGIIDLGMQLVREAKEHNTPPSQGEVERVKVLLDLYALIRS